MTSPRVLHAIPGRVRVRLPEGLDGEAVAGLARAQPGVVTAEWTPLTRSLLVRYDPRATSPSALLAAGGPGWARAGGEAGALAAVPAAPATLPSARMAGAIRRAVGDLDLGVARATGGWLDLGLLLSLGLFTWAVRELVRGQMAPLAWSSALWYAHGLFRDYHAPDPALDGG